MLLFSYIISAALEAAITYIQYQGTGEFPWIYALLAASSLMSIGIEFSAPGEAARQALKEAGKNLEQYDMISNFARTGESEITPVSKREVFTKASIKI